LLVKTLPAIAEGLSYEAQDEAGMTYAKKLQNDERVVDWSMSAASIDRVVRCFAPKPGARTLLKGKWLKILHGEALASQSKGAAGEVLASSEGLDVCCGEHSLYRIHHLQMEGKKSMSAQDFLRGANMHEGFTLG